jgi:hypothetical protein
VRSNIAWEIDLSPSSGGGEGSLVCNDGQSGGQARSAIDGWVMKHLSDQRGKIIAARE